MPLDRVSGTDSYPSKLSIVLHPLTLCSLQLVYFDGTPLVLMSCIKRVSTMLGNTLFMSRNRALTTSFLRHASFTYLDTKCRESNVILPGQQPKWLSGRRAWTSAIWVRSLATQ